YRHYGVALLRGHDRRPVLRGTKDHGLDAPGGRRGTLLRHKCLRQPRLLLRHPLLRAALHAYDSALQQHRLPANDRPGPPVSLDPRLWYDGLDRRRTPDRFPRYREQPLYLPYGGNSVVGAWRRKFRHARYTP